MGLGRKALNTRDRMDALETNARNRIVKDKERARRDARMMAKIKAGSLPYTTVVMNWLSQKLGKKAAKITQEDIQALQG